MTHESPNRGTQWFPLCSCVIAAHPARHFLQVSPCQQAMGKASAVQQFWTPFQGRCEFSSSSGRYIICSRSKREEKEKRGGEPFRGSWRRGAHGRCPWQKTHGCFWRYSWAFPEETHICYCSSQQLEPTLVAWVSACHLGRLSQSSFPDFILGCFLIFYVNLKFHD